MVAALPFALADPTAEHGTERRSPASAQVEFIDSSPEGIAMTAPDRFIAWCKQEEASVEQQLVLLEKGKVRTGEDTGAGWIDTTALSIQRARARLAELKSLLTESGAATVSKAGPHL